MKGFADLHTHLFAHMAHGGKVLAGKPYSFDGVNIALASCKKLHGWLHTAIFNDASTIGTGTNDMKDKKDSNEGVPSFKGWLTWQSTIHQQMYYK